MGETANTSGSDTGPLSMDEAVDALMQPLPPPTRRNTQPAAAADPQPEPEPEEDDETGADLSADTDHDEPQPAEDDAASGEDTPQPTTEPQYEVTVDGKKTSIPVSELVKGYQRQAVFTQRSQVLADERRTFERERDAVSKERGQYARLLTALQAQVDGGGDAEPDWDALQRDDPVAYSIEWARWGQRQRKLAAIRAEQGRIAEAEAEESRKALRQHLTTQHELLLEKVPAYKDQATLLKDRDAIKTFAVSTYGFTQQEIDQLIDHRAVLVMRDARAYRELMAKRGLVEKRVVDTGAPLPNQRGTPAAQTTVRVKSADERLTRTGKLQDAVELELARARARKPNGDGSRNR